MLSKKFDERVTALANLVRILLECKSVYTSYYTDSSYAKKCYVYEPGSVLDNVSSSLVRLWNNSCFTNTSDSYEMQISNILYTVHMPEINTEILVIRKEDVIYNAIPIGCSSLSGVNIYSVYEGDDTMSFSRILTVLDAIFKIQLVEDPEMFLSKDEHLCLRIFKSQVIMSLILKYAMADSDKVKRYGISVNNVVPEIIKSVYTAETVKPLAEITNSAIQYAFELTKQHSFGEVMSLLFDENQLAKYYRQMADMIYIIDHPEAAPATSVETKTEEKVNTTDSIENLMDGAFDLITAKAKSTKLKNRKVNISLEDSNVPNTRMFA